MKFDKHSLGPALKVWRERKDWSVPEVVARSKDPNISKTPFDANTAHLWEAHKRYPKFDHLVEDILPAYGITSFDQFLLLCCTNQNPDVGSVRHIKRKDLTGNKELGVEISSARASLLGEATPVRIDMMSVDEHGESSFATHQGYNYLLVTRGHVKCHFSDGQKEKVVELTEGDAVAFSTLLKHKVESVDGQVDIVVARSAWGPKPHRIED